MTLPSIDLSALERLARAATPGPWHQDLIHESMRGAPDYAHIKCSQDSKPIAYVDRSEHDSTYIAAMSPDVALQLIDRVRKAEAVLQIAKDAWWPRHVDDAAHDAYWAGRGIRGAVMAALSAALGSEGEGT